MSGDYRPVCHVPRCNQPAVGRVRYRPDAGRWFGECLTHALGRIADDYAVVTDTYQALTALRDAQQLEGQAVLEFEEAGS